MAHCDDKNNQPVIFDFGDHAEIVEPEATIARPFIDHRFGSTPRISESGYFFKSCDNARTGRTANLAQLLARHSLVLKRPDQARASSARG